MYPRLDDFLTVRREVDPAGLFNSDLAELELEHSVINAARWPQSLLLLGGTSDIALALARRYARRGFCGSCWPPAPPSADEAAAELSCLGCPVVEVDLEARDHGSHATTIDAAFAGGDIDIALVAFGLLGDPEQAWKTPISPQSWPR